ncbi:ribonuclease HII [Nicoliella lavandulae]|uniref:Ribonuclease HII n=1 Tax=Nicoliella lavandulae TaxID=3082954 RepID=A0ABU8SL73_9LACO
MTKTIKEIKAELARITSKNDERLVQLKSDPRKGVQSALKQRLKQIQALIDQRAAFQARFHYERELWHQGVRYVAGVDEVGRGPLAGPVVAAAAIIPADFDLLAVNDSKQLTPAKRAELAPLIKDAALATSIGVQDSHVIDDVNIYEATRLAMKDAVNGLMIPAEHIIVDAMQIDVPIPQTRLIKGDAKSISVSAASILAKVYRDHLMDEYALQYPEYDFPHNAGYGTAKHLAALKQYGATPIHRISFAPVKKIMEK